MAPRNGRNLESKEGQNRQKQGELEQAAVRSLLIPQSGGN